jgi:hypothetical protein
LALSFGLPLPFFLTPQKSTQKQAAKRVSYAQTAFAHYMTSTSSQTILLSDEHFFNVARSKESSDNFASFFRRFFDRTVVVCYVRPYLDLIYSTYNQAIKIGKKYPRLKFCRRK